MAVHVEFVCQSMRATWACLCVPHMFALVWFSEFLSVCPLPLMFDRSDGCARWWWRCVSSIQPSACVCVASEQCVAALVAHVCARCDLFLCVCVFGSVPGVFASSVLCVRVWRERDSLAWWCVVAGVSGSEFLSLTSFLEGLGAE